MKRASFVLTAVLLGSAATYLVLRTHGEAKHLKVSTAHATVIHIATENPETSLMVSEEDGVVSVIITKLKGNGDYADGRIYLKRTDENIGVILSQRKQGVVTLFDQPDADGLPKRKYVKAKEGIRGFERQTLEWTELPPRDQKPNPDAGRSSP